MPENSEENTSQEESILVEERSGSEEEMKKEEEKQLQHSNMPIGYAGYRYPRWDRLFMTKGGGRLRPPPFLLLFYF